MCWKMCISELRLNSLRPTDYDDFIYFKNSNLLKDIKRLRSIEIKADFLYFWVKS